MVLSDEELKAVHLTEGEARLELALALYARERITLAQGAHLAGIPFLEFQRARGQRGIPIHYDTKMLEEDLRQAGYTPA